MPPFDAATGIVMHATPELGSVTQVTHAPGMHY